LAVVERVTKIGVAPPTRPLGSMKALMPVLAARTSQMRFSMARKRAMERC
jgi:hypothetical protein